MGARMSQEGDTINTEIDDLESRWYFVSMKTGMVTLCADENDARHESMLADSHYPHHAPHVVTRLFFVDIDTNGAGEN